mgnify:CR=1 FL=1
MSEKIQPSEPIASKNKLAFESTKAEYMERLAAIGLPGDPERLVAKKPQPTTLPKGE